MIRRERCREYDIVDAILGVDGVGGLGLEPDQRGASFGC